MQENKKEHHAAEKINRLKVFLIPIFIQKGNAAGLVEMKENRF